MTPNHRKPYRDDLLGCYRVPLTQGRTAFIDRRDVLRVSRRVWCWIDPANGHLGFAYSQGPRPERHMTLLAHFVLGIPRSRRVRVVHLNDDPLDCRRANLRICKVIHTAQHRHKRPQCSSEFKGVSWDRRTSKWRAHIYDSGRTTYLGSHESEQSAAAAYDAEAIKRYGEFARLNLSTQETP